MIRNVGIALAMTAAVAYAQSSSDLISGLAGRLAKLVSTAKLTVTGNSPGIATFGNTNDWLSAIANCTTNCATVWSQSPSGYIGILGASRTSDNPLAGSMGTIGVTGFAINDDAVNVKTAYAGYFEARKYSGAGITQGVEMGIVNQGSVVTLDPFSLTQTGQTLDLWLSSGRPDVTTNAANATAAIGIINNNTAFETGIVFGQGAIHTVSGEAKAIQFAPNDALLWYGGAGSITSRIRSDATAASLGLVFSNGLLNFQDMSGTQLVSINTSGTVTAKGNVSANGVSYMLGNLSGQTLPGDSTTTGTSTIGWNRQSGSGETDFVNAKGAGSAGGFAWWQWSGSATTQTANIDATGNFSAGATINTASYTVAGLPAGVIGRRAIVTNATSCTFMGAITGGGSTFCPVIYNGSAWVGG
ncbi:hypothetical protein [Burkholderia seminalis]|uniref:hypothetical protein n=1 Tax=Burkholderia seminalis TaxID=488731 RepID=UPI000F5A0158|nr:hypothetical protein [Burkholderia seminalis]